MNKLIYLIILTAFMFLLVACTVPTDAQPIDDDSTPINIDIIPKVDILQILESFEVLSD